MNQRLPQPGPWAIYPEVMATSTGEVIVPGGNPLRPSTYRSFIHMSTAQLNYAVCEIADTIYAHVRACNPVTMPAVIHELIVQSPEWSKLNDFYKGIAINEAVNKLLSDALIELDIDAANGTVALDLHH